MSRRVGDGASVIAGLAAGAPLSTSTSERTLDRGMAPLNGVPMSSVQKMEVLAVRFDVPALDR